MGNDRNPGTWLRVLSESYPMNTNTTGFGCLSKTFAFFCLKNESSLSITLLMLGLLSFIILIYTLKVIAADPVNPDVII